MTIEKLYAIFDFISLGSSVTDCPLDKQSPGYICEKFKQYIGEFEDFDFPNYRKFNFEEAQFMKEYMALWCNVNYLSINESLLPKFKIVLAFLYRANWDSGTLPSRKIEIFEELIGNCSNIKESEYQGLGLHPLLNKWLDDLVADERLQKDLTKLKREFDINNILDE